MTGAVVTSPLGSCRRAGPLLLVALLLTLVCDRKPVPVTPAERPAT